MSSGFEKTWRYRQRIILTFGYVYKLFGSFCCLKHFWEYQWKSFLTLFEEIARGGNIHQKNRRVLQHQIVRSLSAQKKSLLLQNQQTANFFISLYYLKENRKILKRYKEFCKFPIDRNLFFVATSIFQPFDDQQRIENLQLSDKF